MSDMQASSVAAPQPQGPGLSQMQRVINVFSAPSKTFIDIRDHSRSWWLPFLIIVVVSYVLFGAITAKIGWAQVAENAIHMNAKAEERMAQAPPEQRETTMKITQYSMEGGFAATPILVIVIIALGSLILWGTINFGFGGKAKYGTVLAMWMYAGLPGVIKSLLGTIVIFTGIAPETFNLANFAPTSVGAFLNPVETNAAIYTLASALDITSIWSMVLLGIGIAIVAGVKRSSGYIAVFGWWGLILVIRVGWAAAFG